MSTSPDSVLYRLKGVRKQGAGWVAQYPAHADRNPSLSINISKEGKVLLKCHAGCDIDRIVAAMGMTLSDLMPDRRDDKAGQRIVAKYDYTDGEGRSRP